MHSETFAQRTPHARAPFVENAPRGRRVAIQPGDRRLAAPAIQRHRVPDHARAVEAQRPAGAVC